MARMWCISCARLSTIDKFCAPGLFDPPTYSQGIKVTQAQTILFLSGQVAYMPDGTAAFRGDRKLDQVSAAH